RAEPTAAPAISLVMGMEVGHPAIETDLPSRGASVPDGAASSGWPLHPKERRDFYHRVHAFPPEVADWRQALVERIRSNPGRVRGGKKRDTYEDVRARLDQGIVYLREIARILALLNGPPPIGNKDDPVDELVYIILSRKTREEAYQRTFDLLKRRFPDWTDLLRAPRTEVTRLVFSGGLSGRKTESLYGALGQLRDTFGRCTLEPARAWSDAQLEALLCSLPEISKKSAYCIMMYAFGRQVFPVDTHVGRVLSRLGPYRDLGLDLGGLDHKKLQAVLADLIPPNLRYS